jgi:hypothetical protein
VRRRPADATGEWLNVGAQARALRVRQHFAASCRLSNAEPDANAFWDTAQASGLLKLASPALARPLDAAFADRRYVVCQHVWLWRRHRRDAGSRGAPQLNLRR